MSIHLYLSRSSDYLCNKILENENIFWNETIGKSEFIYNNNKIIIYLVPKNYCEKLKKEFEKEIECLLKNHNYNFQLTCSADLTPFIKKIITKIDKEKYQEKEKEIQLLKLENEALKMKIQLIENQYKHNYK